MDTYVDAATRTGASDPLRVGRFAYNKRMFGAVYPPAIEEEVLAVTRALNTLRTTPNPSPTLTQT